jgi:hypothetical protein
VAGNNLYPAILTFLANSARAEDVLKITKAQAQVSHSALSIQFANDLLTVNAKDVPLKEVLEEIGGDEAVEALGEIGGATAIGLLEQALAD